MREARGLIYLGDHVAGDAAGHGQCMYANGVTYRGELRGGIAEGLGVCQYETGDVYFGEFRRGEARGSCKIECVPIEQSLAVPYLPAGATEAYYSTLVSVQVCQRRPVLAAR